MGKVNQSMVTMCAVREMEGRIFTAREMLDALIQYGYTTGPVTPVMKSRISNTLSTMKKRGMAETLGIQPGSKTAKLWRVISVINGDLALAAKRGGVYHYNFPTYEAALRETATTGKYVKKVVYSDAKHRRCARVLASYLGVLCEPYRGGSFKTFNCFLLENEDETNCTNRTNHQSCAEDGRVSSHPQKASQH